jgi:hypothetical protein
MDNRSGGPCACNRTLGALQADGRDLASRAVQAIVNNVLAAIARECAREAGSCECRPPEPGPPGTSQPTVAAPNPPATNGVVNVGGGPGSLAPNPPAAAAAAAR